MTESINIIDGSEMVMTLESYGLSSIKEVFGIDLVTFMELPIWIGDRLIQIAHRIQSQKNKLQESILSDIDTELSQLTD